MNASFLRRSRLLSGLFTAVLATGIVAGIAAPASAGSPHNKIDYVALGDSYAAGQGGGHTKDWCNHTKAAYPRAVDKLRGVKLIADGSCTGADTWDLLKVQIPELKWKIKKAELVTITIGANDVVLNPEIVAACNEAPAASTAPVEDPCETLVKEAIKKVKERVLKALVKIDDLNHKVKVIVTGYPHLYEAENAFEARVNAGVDALNSALHWAVTKAKHWGVRAKYVDVTGIFAGHGIHSDDPWIHEDGKNQWHPNKKGHWAYSHVVVHKVKHLF
jgi:lysophospholipase L1-like esterase